MVGVSVLVDVGVFVVVAVAVGVVVDVKVAVNVGVNVLVWVRLAVADGVGVGSTVSAEQADIKNMQTNAIKQNETFIFPLLCSKISLLTMLRVWQKIYHQSILDFDNILSFHQVQRIRAKY